MKVMARFDNTVARQRLSTPPAPPPASRAAVYSAAASSKRPALNAAVPFSLSSSP
eukprot:CAMPEP_0181384734 /NCGR_PEP_ID=MMETSP1106-20121128/22146_1 /TAXON_ID=81844 /ORGANISM="Mantoniella antarctica, Strain SL-175" /LENGTH=54 /DNA_ID=CAMNT_0023504671 /DNA_START=332 /DNA_END=492 /DNA_ORIENTATION=-